MSDRIREKAEQVANVLFGPRTTVIRIDVIEAAIREAVKEERRALRGIVDNEARSAGVGGDALARSIREGILAALDARDAESKSDLTHSSAFMNSEREL